MQLGDGEVFAGYTIVRPLGAGGVGEVYLAQHPRLPRRDALKVLGPQVSASATYRERFLREADQAATLSHPNIVTVLDRGEDNGQLWIAMAYIDGDDAANMLARRWPAGMPVELVTAIVMAVASALDYAHRQGLLHRDVKPGNILITDAESPTERRILLADFGIAREIDDASGLTTTNTTLGTVAYAAPEQLMGERIDGRADQYALAATAYQLLTGSTVFPHTNAAVVISHHLNSAPPSLAAMRPELAALDPVLSAALSKDPAGRFASCGDFAQAFAEQAERSPMIAPMAPTAPAPVPTPRPAWNPTPGPVAPTPAAGRLPLRQRRIPIAAALGIVIAIGVGIGGLLWLFMSVLKSGPASTASSPARSATAPPITPVPKPVVATPLDGTYRWTQIHASDPSTYWVAFRYTCTPQGCIATSTFLDPQDLHAPDPEPRSFVWHWLGDHWQSNQSFTSKCLNSSAEQTHTNVFTLRYEGDGNYAVTNDADIVSNECGEQGKTNQFRYTLTRTGPAPMGVVDDPPVSQIGQLPKLPQPR